MDVVEDLTGFEDRIEGVRVARHTGVRNRPTPIPSGAQTRDGAMDDLLARRVD